MKRDDRGFSLVELLIAITMLGIIAAPLLHAFVTSAMTARRSYDMGELTLAAQTAAETVEAESMASIAAKAVENGGKYTYTIADVGGKGKYDARVTLDPADYSAVNSVDITQYTPMDAVFSQTGGGEDPDTEGPAQLALLAQQYDGGALGAVSRVVTITITEQAGGGYSYTCSYEYSAVVSYREGDAVRTETLTFTIPYSFFTGARGASAALAPLYFFFKPFDNPGSYDDHIVVRHNGETPVSVFLAAQNATGNAISWTGYKILVDLRDSLKDTSKVYSNIPKANSALHVYVGEVWYESTIEKFNDSLVAAKAQDRMYGVTIEIYALNDTSAALYTLQSSKLD